MGTLGSIDLVLGENAESAKSVGAKILFGSGRCEAA